MTSLDDLGPTPAAACIVGPFMRPDRMSTQGVVGVDWEEESGQTSALNRRSALNRAPSPGTGAGPRVNTVVYLSMGLCHDEIKS